VARHDNFHQKLRHWLRYLSTNEGQYSPDVPPLSPIKSTTTCPFAVVTTDFITDLPESEGFDSIMVVVDQNTTKGVIFIPTNKTVSAAEAACLYYEKVYTRFGLPDKIISDRDPVSHQIYFRNSENS
jgi:hypothetical protein